MVSISELCDEHRQLEALGARLLKIVAAPVADAAAVAGIRWSMARGLLDHCAHEDESVYDPLMASADPAAVALASHYRQEFGMLSAAYAQYIADWPVDRINRNWDGFRAGTQAMMTRLAARIEGEERELYLHAQRIGTHRHAA